MSSLVDWQEGFAQSLRDAEFAPPSVAQALHDETTGTSMLRRFAIYRNNVAVALIDTLRATYPVVEALVGEAFFKACAQAYVKQAPPRSPLLFRYGAEFGAFLDAFPPARSVPYLGDVAKLEFARLKALHAADATPITLEDIAGLAPTEMTELRFEFHPTATLIQSSFPVVSIWRDVSGHSSFKAVDLGHGESGLIVRPTLDVEVHPISSGGEAFLAALMNGTDLGTAAEIGRTEASDFDLPAQLVLLFQSGSVVGTRSAAC